MTAESLDMLTEEDCAAWNAMTRRGERLAQGLADAFAAASIAAVVQGVGPMLQVLPLRAGHEETEAIHDMREFSPTPTRSSTGALSTSSSASASTPVRPSSCT